MSEHIDMAHVYGQTGLAGGGSMNDREPTTRAVDDRTAAIEAGAMAAVGKLPRLQDSYAARREIAAAVIDASLTSGAVVTSEAVLAEREMSRLYINRYSDAAERVVVLTDDSEKLRLRNRALETGLRELADDLESVTKHMDFYNKLQYGDRVAKARALLSVSSSEASLSDDVQTP